MIEANIKKLIRECWFLIAELSRCQIPAPDDLGASDEDIETMASCIVSDKTISKIKISQQDFFSRYKDILFDIKKNHSPLDGNPMWVIRYANAIFLMRQMQKNYFELTEKYKNAAETMAAFSQIITDLTGDEEIDIN